MPIKFVKLLNRPGTPLFEVGVEHSQTLDFGVDLYNGPDFLSLVEGLSLHRQLVLFRLHALRA